MALLPHQQGSSLCACAEVQPCCTCCGFAPVHLQQTPREVTGAARPLPVHQACRACALTGQLRLLRGRPAHRCMGTPASPARQRDLHVH